VAKKWIDLNIEKRSSTPVRNGSTTGSSKALLFFYFGEKTVGTAAVE
jgi:hypothetical protein